MSLEHPSVFPTDYMARWDSEFKLICEEYTIKELDGVGQVPCEIWLNGIYR